MNMPSRHPERLDWLGPRLCLHATSICSGSMLLCAQGKFPAGIIDYHQHLYSPDAGASSSPGPKGIDANALIAQLDRAGI